MMISFKVKSLASQSYELAWDCFEEALHESPVSML